MGTKRHTLMLTDRKGRIQHHVSDAENPPSCAKGVVRRLSAHDTRGDLVETLAKLGAETHRFGVERLCGGCFTAAEKQDFVQAYDRHTR